MFDLHVWMMGEGGGEEGGLDHISLCCFLSGKARIATSENAFYGDYPILSPSEKNGIPTLGYRSVQILFHLVFVFLSFFPRKKCK